MSKDAIGFRHGQPIIGVLHLLPLPGSPQFDHDTRRILAQARDDADALVRGGVDAIMIENFGDTPYFPKKAPRETIAWMARIGGLIRDRCDLPLGVCVLRNDGRAALAIASAIGAQFIRVCILASPRVTDQGVLQGNAYKLVRDRARLGADVKIFADVDIKYSYPLSPSYSLKADAAALVERSHADALIVTGKATGVSVDEGHLDEIRGVCKVPVYVGSGVTPSNIAQFSRTAGGFIVGTALKESNAPDARVSTAKVRALVTALRERAAA
jgi:membrane complex biogenesis BtpA family protein